MDSVRSVPGTTVYIEVTDAGQVITLDSRFEIVQVIVTSGNVYFRFGDDTLVGGAVVNAGASLGLRDTFMLNSSSEEYSCESHTKLAFRAPVGGTSTVHVNYIG